MEDFMDQTTLYKRMNITCIKQIQNYWTVIGSINDIADLTRCQPVGMEIIKKATDKSLTGLSTW